MKQRHIIIVSILALTLMGATACQKKATNSNTSPGGNISYHAAAPNAFGSLASLVIGNTNGQNSTADSAVARTTAPIKSLLISPNGFKFVFTGTPLALPDATLDVFERSIGAALSMPADLKTAAGLGMMNMGNLDNPKLENLTVRNGDEYWTVNPLDGTISMYQQNTSIVPILKGQAVTETPSSVAQPTNATDLSNTNTALPSVDTAAAIAIANSFLAAQGISTAAYGQPTVTTTPGYVTAMGTADSISSRPFPGYSVQAQIIYPYVINTQTVVQSNGEPMGLTLSVDMTTSTVTSLYGLTTLDFTQSAYDAQTDFSVVQKLAEQGGYSGYYYGSLNAEGTTTTTVNLGTPEYVLMSSYLYADNRSREIYIPALRFPISQPSDGYPKWVVVPLVKDLPSSMPVGILAPDATSGSGGSGTAAVTNP